MEETGQDESKAPVPQKEDVYGRDYVAQPQRIAFITAPVKIGM